MIQQEHLLTMERGMWAVKWSLLGLLVTALVQVVVVFFSGSVALLADTLHNFADAATAIPLWIAFAVARLKPTRRFTYGFGRIEDLAGVMIIVTIALSSVAVAYTAVDRLLNPRTVDFLGVVIAASIIGFLGNEAVAILRTKVGHEIGSAALIADGHHAHVDGLTSLAVVFGAVGVWVGYPLADPIVGLLIAAVIVRIAWTSGKEVFTRLLDGIDPEMVDAIRDAVRTAEGVNEVTEVRVRWVGHQLHSEINVAVAPELSVEQAHEIATEARHQVLHCVPYLFKATIHVDPTSVSGEQHHHIGEHEHGALTVHRH
jgi:cation diffusion facilitator family transporter